MNVQSCLCLCRLNWHIGEFLQDMFLSNIEIDTVQKAISTG